MFGLVIIGTLICWVAGFVFQFSQRRKAKAVAIWAILSLVGNFFMNLILVYAMMPAMTKPLGGLQYLWLPLLINAIVAGAIWMIRAENDDDTPRAGECVGSVGALVLLLVIILFIQIGGNWGEGIAKYKANFLPVEAAAVDAFPSTDAEHLVLVPLSHAMAKGGRALTEGGQNLGSIYKPGSYVLQQVAGHMYWVAPLVYQNILANLSNMTSPGLIVVDAENPDATAVLKTDHVLHYMPEAIFNQDLVRHAYLNGYSGYRLIDPTLEIDDNWVPHFTLDASHFVTGLTGIDVKGILVINSETGEITMYKVEDKPAWVDRVFPQQAVDEYIGWYGNWHISPFWFWNNWQGKDKEMSANDITPIAWSTMEGSPVWQYEMTSQKSTDHASTGVILVDSNKLRAVRYPIYGIAVGSQVNDSFAMTPDNKVTQFPHIAPVLVKIYDRLTWFTVYVSNDTTYATFVAVGLMDAQYTGANNVIMATSKEAALARYHQWVANRPSNTTEVGATVEDLTITGTVDRVQSEVQNGVTYYFFYMKDQTGKILPTVFYGIADQQTAELRFIREGDTVSFSYKLGTDGTATISIFDDLAVPAQ